MNARTRIWTALLPLLAAACGTETPASDAYGHFEAVEVTISAEAAGTVVWMGVDEGDRVEAGMVVARIDTAAAAWQLRALEAGLAAARARLDQVDAQERVLRAQRDNLERERARAARMAAEGAAPAQLAEDLAGQAAVLDRQLEALAPQRAAIRAERASLAAQRGQSADHLARHEARSPLAGTVLRRLVERGELAAPGKPLYQVAALDTLDLRAFVSGDQLASLRLGGAVTVLADAGSGTLREYPGTVRWISARAEFTPSNLLTREDRITLVYAVRIAVPNDGSLKIGMPGEVRFP